MSIQELQLEHTKLARGFASMQTSEPMSVEDIHMHYSLNIPQQQKATDCTPAPGFLVV